MDLCAKIHPASGPKSAQNFFWTAVNILPRVKKHILCDLCSRVGDIFCLLFPFLARFKRSGFSQIWWHRECNNSSLSAAFARKNKIIDHLLEIDADHKMMQNAYNINYHTVCFTSSCSKNRAAVSLFWDLLYPQRLLCDPKTGRNFPLGQKYSQIG